MVRKLLKGCSVDCYQAKLAESTQWVDKVQFLVGLFISCVYFSSGFVASLLALVAISRGVCCYKVSGGYLMSLYFTLGTIIFFGQTKMLRGVCCS